MYTGAQPSQRQLNVSKNPIHMQEAIFLIRQVSIYGENLPWITFAILNIMKPDSKIPCFSGINIVRTVPHAKSIEPLCKARKTLDVAGSTWNSHLWGSNLCR